MIMHIFFEMFKIYFLIDFCLVYVKIIAINTFDFISSAFKTLIDFCCCIYYEKFCWVSVFFLLTTSECCPFSCVVYNLVFALLLVVLFLRCAVCISHFTLFSISAISILRHLFCLLYSRIYFYPCLCLPYPPICCTFCRITSYFCRSKVLGYSVFLVFVGFRIWNILTIVCPLPKRIRKNLIKHRASYHVSRNLLNIIKFPEVRINEEYCTIIPKQNKR